MGAIFSWVSATSHSLAHGGALDSGIPYTTTAPPLQVPAAREACPEFPRQARGIENKLLSWYVVPAGIPHTCQAKKHNERAPTARGGRRHGHVPGAASGSREQLVS